MPIQLSSLIGWRKSIVLLHIDRLCLWRYASRAKVAARLCRCWTKLVIKYYTEAFHYSACSIYFARCLVPHIISYCILFIVAVIMFSWYPFSMWWGRFSSCMVQYFAVLKPACSLINCCSTMGAVLLAAYVHRACTYGRAVTSVCSSL